LNIIFKNFKMNTIEINQPNYILKDVVRVGCDVSKVKDVLGNNYIHEEFLCPDSPGIPDYKMIYRGIVFEVEHDRVIKITVKKV
ncbi:MAG: hypothetical protein ACLFQV_12210, partial [Vulcanimicrobiota bacterium]